MITIRPATRADANPIAHVHVESWQSTYNGIVPDTILSALSIERRATYWHDLIPSLKQQHSCLFVATNAAGNVIGFANGGPEREGDLDYKGELYAIYLYEGEQGQGIGRKLTQAVANHLISEGFNSMLVWVLKDNPSCKFYQRMGGHYIREKQITIEAATLPEVAYGWNNIAASLL